ncbi:hypothetical protein HDZ31DRAFT_29490 [Schizophyllum fasciatum]
MAHEEYTPQLSQGGPSLADLLTITPSVSIFYSYARELQLSSLFADSSRQITLFAPTNKAVVSLPRKPHEDPTIKEGIITEQEYDSRSKRNIERWVEAHIVPASDVDLVPGTTVDTLLSGKSITFDKLDTPGDEDWQRVVLEDDVKVIDKKQGANGVLYIIDGTVAPN